MLELLLLLGLVVVAGALRTRIRDLEAKVGAQQEALDGLTRTLGTGPPPVARPPDSPRQASAPPLPAGSGTTGAARAITTAAAQGPTAPPKMTTPQPSANPSASGPSLEERLGTRWAVWLGGAALALGGILMVHYSIERGFFGPGVRLILAALFSLALLAAGEWLRRSDKGIDLGGAAAPHIPSIVTAAGTVAGFGTIYAAHALYGFIGPAAAFVLLGAAGVATMFAAALHGPALAGLGLAGSLATPMLIASTNPSAWPVVLHVGVVAAAAYWLARARRWLWLAACVVAGAIVWGLLLCDAVGPNQATWSTALFVHGLVQLALAAFFMALEPHVAETDEAARIDWIASAALAALTTLAVVILAATRFEATGWLLFAVAAMAIVGGTAYRIPAVAPAAVFAGIVALGVVTFWPGLKGTPELRFLWPAVAGYVRVPELIQSYLMFAAMSRTRDLGFCDVAALDRAQARRGRGIVLRARRRRHAARRSRHDLPTRDTVRHVLCLCRHRRDVGGSLLSRRRSLRQRAGRAEIRSDAILHRRLRGRVFGSGGARVHVRSQSWVPDGRIRSRGGDDGTVCCDR